MGRIGVAMNPCNTRFPVMAGALALALSTGCAHLPSDTGPIPASRPGLTEDAALVPVGSFQAEAGVEGGRMGGEDFMASEFLLRHGLHRSLEARLALATAGGRGSDAPGQAVEDLELGLKVRLAPGGEGLMEPSLTLIPSASIPTGADRLSSGSVEPGARLVAEWDLGGLFEWGGNLGATAAEGVEGRFAELFIGGVMARSLSDELAVEAELVRIVGVGGRAPGSGLWHGALGAAWLVHKDASLDASLGYRKSGRSDGGFVSLGMSVRR
jgi:hypothetical protein